MTRATVIGAVLAVAAVLLVVALVVRDRSLDVEPAAATLSAIAPSASTAPHPGFIYGRITTVDGDVHEGRLRWAGVQEAFWSDYFNGTKEENRWAVQARLERSPEERGGVEIFGFRVGGEERSTRFRRLFMARFGDIARIDAHVRLVRVTLKSGTVIELDRFAAGDIDDGVRVWDSKGQVADLDAREIRTIEFLPKAPPAAAADRLHGTVHTRLGDFTGFILWDQQDGLSGDALDGRTSNGEVHLRYDTIRSIARHSRDRATVTLVDGRQLVLSGSSEVSYRNRGIYVDDRRYGRVLISWDAFEHVDFSAGGNGPAYGDFPAGRPLAGTVTTRDGRRLAGRLVYDLDESETTETFDAPFQGVDYNIPFRLITSIVPAARKEDGTHRPTVILRDAEELQLDRDGDFGEGNAGMLIFVEGRERPEYVQWANVEQIDLDDGRP